MEKEASADVLRNKEVWRFHPHYWDEQKGEWLISADLQPGEMKTQVLRESGLKVLSYNIWFGQHMMPERMIALGDLIRKHSPDIIALQEVTPYLIQLLLMQAWSHEYFVSDPQGKELSGGYGVMVLSKVKWNVLCLRDFPSKMGRKALIGTLKLDDGNQVLLGTFHLESYPRDLPVRKEQLERLRDLTSDASIAILCGDTNFVSDSEADTLSDKYKDAWSSLKDKGVVKMKGLTFDTSVNVMSRTKNGFSAFTRIDRMFYTVKTLEPVSFEIIGREPITCTLGEKIWPSDHFGIVVVLQLKTPSK